MEKAALPATSMLTVSARRHACMVFLRCAVAGVRGAAGAAVPTHRGIGVGAQTNSFGNGGDRACKYLLDTRAMLYSQRSAI